MKHEIHETTTFIRTRYTCDACHYCLLPGAKPLRCSVCEAEVCSGCYLLLDFTAYACYVCAPCALQTETLDHIQRIAANFQAGLAILLAEWKEASRPA